MTKRRAIVIGAGVGGLAAAVHLRRAGLEVKLLERAARVGGKLREVEVGGRTFDAGPSVFTMRWVFDELFGGQLSDHLRIAPIEPLCRHWFADGSRLDLFVDEEKSRAAIEKFAGAASARGYLAYRKHAARIFEIVRKPFMENAVPTVFELMNPIMLYRMTQIDGLRTLWKALEQFFPDPRLRTLFGRYATYNGSSPYHAPATLAVIAHVENAYGIFACEGGIYQLAAALEKLARSLGVEIATETDVEELTVAGGRVTGVRLRGGAVESAEVVVANCDAAHVYSRLLAAAPQAAKLATKYGGEELSLSAFTMMALARTPTVPLVHHNVFFSADYQQEFVELVGRRRPPVDPTLYICAQDRTFALAGQAPPSPERLFFLTNAPAVDKTDSAIDWAEETSRCRDRIGRTLERHRWTLETEAESTVGPREFAALFPSSRGALYGLSSNSAMAAFKRPANRVPGVAGLYLAGGTAHPGAGLPMVALSARIAVGLALEDLRRS